MQRSIQSKALSLFLTLLLSLGAFSAAAVGLAATVKLASPTVYAASPGGPAASGGITEFGNSDWWVAVGESFEIWGEDLAYDYDGNRLDITSATSNDSAVVTASVVTITRQDEEWDDEEQIWIPGESYDMQVALLTGVSVGDTTVNVTVSNGTETKDITLNLTVPEPIAVSMNRTSAYTFSSTRVGYDALTPLTVTVNAGDLEYSDERFAVELIGSDRYDFTLNYTSETADRIYDDYFTDYINSNESKTFTVAPNTGLEVGTYRAKVVLWAWGVYQTFDVSFTVTATNVDSSSSSSSSSGGGSGSGSSAPSTPTLSPVNTASAVKDVKDAIAAAAKNSANGAAVTLKNVTTVTLDTLKEMAKAAGNTALKVQADSLNPDGSIDVRITIDPSSATKGVNLSASTTSPAAQIAKIKFEKHFDNTVSTVSLSQKGSFGTPVRVAAKIDKSLNTNTLVFYSYDSATNSFTKIENPQYTVDKNGYVHFNTSVGGEIIISDKPLTRK